MDQDIKDIIEKDRADAKQMLLKHLSGEIDNIFEDPCIVTITDMEKAIRAAKNKFGEALLEKVVDLKKR